MILSISPFSELYTPIKAREKTCWVPLVAYGAYYSCFFQTPKLSCNPQ